MYFSVNDSRDDGFFRHTVPIFTEFCNVLIEVRWIGSYFDGKFIKYKSHDTFYVNSVVQNRWRSLDGRIVKLV